MSRSTFRCAGATFPNFRKVKRNGKVRADIYSRLERPVPNEEGPAIAVVYYLQRKPSHVRNNKFVSP